MDEAYTAFGKAVIALETAKSDAVTEVVARCIITGSIAFVTTLVFSGYNVLAAGAVAGITCAGILAYNVIVKAPGLAEATANMNSARDTYNSWYNTYTNCMEVHLFTYH